MADLPTVVTKRAPDRMSKASGDDWDDWDGVETEDYTEVVE